MLQDVTLIEIETAGTRWIARSLCGKRIWIAPELASMFADYGRTLPTAAFPRVRTDLRVSITRSYSGGDYQLVSLRTRNPHPRSARRVENSARTEF